MAFLTSAKAVSILHSFGYSVESDALGPLGSVEKTDG